MHDPIGISCSDHLKTDDSRKTTYGTNGTNVPFKVQLCQPTMVVVGGWLFTTSLQQITRKAMRPEQNWHALKILKIRNQELIPLGTFCSNLVPAHASILKVLGMITYWFNSGVGQAPMTANACGYNNEM